MKNQLCVALCLCLAVVTAASSVMRRPALHELFQVQAPPAASLPTSFDARAEWPGCIGAVLNQGDCGSCWAFAASEVLSDRFCIASGGAVNVTLSPENLLECEKLNLKCEMGSLPQWAWAFLTETGVATMDCVPYTSGGGQTPKCSHQCAAASQPYTLYRSANYSQLGDFIHPEDHVSAIMAGLVADGPVDTTFNVYAD
eukprot:c11908_g1_i1.p2 GENE.c11908_g1_i1~~c11908_g1_i1.p2  ORF type:complete len:199 (-),score=28.23 c11908_g1_i1:356-952(-)